MTITNTNFQTLGYLKLDSGLEYAIKVAFIDEDGQPVADYCLNNNPGNLQKLQDLVKNLIQTPQKDLKDLSVIDINKQGVSWKKGEMQSHIELKTDQLWTEISKLLVDDYRQHDHSSNCVEAEISLPSSVSSPSSTSSTPQATETDPPEQEADDHTTTTVDQSTQVNTLSKTQTQAQENLLTQRFTPECPTLWETIMRGVRPLAPPSSVRYSPVFIDLPQDARQDIDINNKSLEEGIGLTYHTTQHLGWKAFLQQLEFTYDAHNYGKYTEEERQKGAICLIEECLTEALRLDLNNLKTEIARLNKQISSEDLRKFCNEWMKQARELLEQNGIFKAITTPNKYTNAYFDGIVIKAQKSFFDEIKAQKSSTSPS